MAPINVGTGVQIKNGDLGINNLAVYYKSFFGQNVAIGTTTNNATATIQIVDGNQGAGKILTSDASGTASWQAGGGSSYYFIQPYILSGNDTQTYNSDGSYNDSGLACLKFTNSTATYGYTANSYVVGSKPTPSTTANTDGTMINNVSYNNGYSISNSRYTRSVYIGNGYPCNNISLPSSIPSNAKALLVSFTNSPYTGALAGVIAPIKYVWKKDPSTSIPFVLNTSYVQITNTTNYVTYPYLPLQNGSTILPISYDKTFTLDLVGGSSVYNSGVREVFHLEIYGYVM